MLLVQITGGKNSGSISCSPTLRIQGADSTERGAFLDAVQKARSVSSVLLQPASPDQLQTIFIGKGANAFPSKLEHHATLTKYDARTFLSENPIPVLTDLVKAFLGDPMTVWMRVQFEQQGLLFTKELSQ